MHARYRLLPFGLMLATAPIAHAAQKDPVPGTVTCYCSCNSVNAEGKELNYQKIIGGTEGTWSQSRGACQAFNGSKCAAKDSAGNWHTGDLKNCDTFVHREKGPGSKQTAPAADTLAPATETPSGGATTPKLRFKQQRAIQ